jgi:hypothetical protein
MAFNFSSSAVTHLALLARPGDMIGAVSGWTVAAVRNLWPVTAVDQADQMGRGATGRAGETTSMFIAPPTMAGSTVAQLTPAAEFDWFVGAANPLVSMEYHGDPTAGGSGSIAVAGQISKSANPDGSLIPQSQSIALPTIWGATTATRKRATAFASSASAANQIVSTATHGDTIGEGSGWTAAAARTLK